MNVLNFAYRFSAKLDYKKINENNKKTLSRKTSSLQNICFFT